MPSPKENLPLLDEFRLCVVIPTYNNPRTIGQVVHEVRRFVSDLVVVDDGGNETARSTCQALAERSLCVVVRHDRNQGKGAAVKTALRRAHELGFTHALQVDADGQHDLEAIPRFIERARQLPNAAVFSYPQYDASAPKSRQSARKITNFWVNLEAGRGVIRDAMIGFRIYPLSRMQMVSASSNGMDFDVEIAVRLAWAGIYIENMPIQVRYLSAEEGGVSHFRPLADNIKMSVLHSKLCTVKCMATVFAVLPLPHSLRGFLARKWGIPPCLPSPRRSYS